MPHAVPHAAELIADLIATNMDWPGADAIAARLRRALPPGIDGDAPEPGQAPAPVDPMAQLLAAKAEAEIVKTQAEAQGKLLDNAKKSRELAGEAGGIEAPVAPAAP